ncbi:MAG: amidase [Hyphomicrobiales bacterium]|nr:amidase [Hyphomicrobiales bacterium]
MGRETLTGREIVRDIREGRASCETVMEACLARVEAREDEVGAFAYLDPEQALRKARQADRAGRQGPMHGVPFIIKDIIDTDDMPTGWGFAPYGNRQPSRNARCVELFIEAGAIPLGKAVTTEMAFYQPGKTANPRNLAHTPGGSSSGTAAAVADFMAPIGFGSQTAGSIIRPASFCGVAGYKPTLGLYDMSGIMPLSESLDAVGLMARSVDDIALGHSVLGGQDNQFADQNAGRVPRIGFMREPHWQEASADMRANCEKAAELLAARGASVSDLTPPPIFAELAEAQRKIMAYEIARSRGHEYEACYDALSAHYRGLIEDGRAISDEDYRNSLQLAQDGKSAVAGIFADFDAILTPAAPGEAPEGLGSTGDPVFNRIWTLLQLPCVSIPFGTGPKGLPLSVQIVGSYRGDLALLGHCGWIEKQLSL